jgi:hypothetical protein
MEPPKLISPALYTFLLVNFGWHGLHDWQDGDLRF